MAGYSSAAFAESLRRTIAGWRRDPAIVEAAVGTGRGLPPAAILVPSDTPAPLLNALAAAAVTGRALVVRPSSARLAFVEALIHRVAGSSGMEGVSWAPGRDVADLARTCSLVLAYGGDETMRHVAATAGTARVALHGDRVSVAIVRIGGPEDARDAAQAIARDIVPWDGNGCLTPRILAVCGVEGRSGGMEAEGGAAAQLLAEAIADRLAECEERMPRARPPESVSLAIHGERAACRARGGCVLAPRTGTSWSVLREREAAVQDTSGWRTVRILPVRDPDEFRDRLRKDWPRIEAVGAWPVQGPERGPGTVPDEAKALFGDRVEPLGWMQSPSLARRQSGNASLLELLADRASV